MLYFLENCDVFGQLVKRLHELGAVFGEGVPVDKGLLAGELQDGVKVLLDVLDLYIAHVEGK